MSKKTPETELPDEAEIALKTGEIADLIKDERFSRVRNFFKKLEQKPPRVILLEGGNAHDRMRVAQLWALMLNCPKGEDYPCLQCPVCIRMATHMHRDYFFLDGLDGSIKIDTLRDEVLPTLGEPPREARYRVVVFREAQYMTEAAANIMLKSLEEPVSDTSFLLLAPQRERLLQTLVSRSMVITLPWPDSNALVSDDLYSWEADICTFIQTGRSLLSRTGQRGAMDMQLAQEIIHLCRSALVRSLAGEEKEGLTNIFSQMPKSRQRMVDEILAVAQENLLFTVNPALVIEWTITRFFFLFPRS